MLRLKLQTVSTSGKDRQGSINRNKRREHTTTLFNIFIHISTINNFILTYKCEQYFKRHVETTAKIQTVFVTTIISEQVYIPVHAICKLYNTKLGIKLELHLSGLLRWATRSSSPSKYFYYNIREVLTTMITTDLVHKPDPTLLVGENLPLIPGCRENV